MHQMLRGRQKVDRLRLRGKVSQIVAVCELSFVDRDYNVSYIFCKVPKMRRKSSNTESSMFEDIRKAGPCKVGTCMQAFWAHKSNFSQRWLDAGGDHPSCRHAKIECHWDFSISIRRLVGASRQEYTVGATQRMDNAVRGPR